MLKILLTRLVMLVGSGESPVDPVQSAARQIADQISHPSLRLPTMYAPALLSAVSEEQLAAIYSSLDRQYGPVLRVTAASPPSPLAGQFALEFRNVQIVMTLHLEEGGEHRVDGLWFGPAQPKLSSLADVAARLAALPGNVSFQLQCLDTGQVLASVHPEKTMAIGSAFKLYLLETLVRNKVAWGHLVVLQDRYKSLPTGELRTWPAGSPLTVHTLAADMISNSDNTAADHLLALEGRGTVEAILPQLGMANPGLDTPFLNTRELFQMRANPDLLNKYLSENLKGRRAILDKIDAEPPPDVSQIPTSQPAAIAQVEWFASAADLCRLLALIDREDDPTARSILAINPGLPFPADRFSYIGYKGGSEPGVLNMTWLLHSRAGHHYALTASWNNPDSDVDLEQFSGLMLAAANLLDDSSPATQPGGER